MHLCQLTYGSGLSIIYIMSINPRHVQPCLLCVPNRVFSNILSERILGGTFARYLKCFVLLAVSTESAIFKIHILLVYTLCT